MTDTNAHNFGVIARQVEAVGGLVALVGERVNEVDERVGGVASDVGRVSADLQSTNHELLELRKQFTEFVLQAERTANVQRSETKLGTLKADLEREFGHYNVVRRSSIGTLQAFDAGLVSHAAVQHVSEELMIQSPRYWLAPALVALAAWSRDERELADKAVAETFARDRQKASLFFALVLRRQARLDGATRWLRHYFTSLDPRALHREFAVVLEGVAHEAYGPAGRDLVFTQLGEWSRLLRDDQAIVREQVEKWYRELSVHRGTIDDAAYPTLSTICPEWPVVKDVLERASAVGFVFEKYDSVLKAPIHQSLRVEDQMDDLLEILVTEYDAEEHPHRREIVFHEAVLSSGGDLDRAREAADADIEALEDTLDAVSLVTHSAIHPELLGISQNTQKLAVGAGKSDFESGLGRFTSEYRAAHLDVVTLALGPAHSNFASTLGFGSWSVTTRTQQAEAEASLSSAWDQAVKGYIDSVSFKNRSFVAPAIATAVAGLIGTIWGIGGFFIALLIVGGISALYVWNLKRKADALVAAALATREQALAVSRDLYRSALAEWVDAGIDYQEADAREASLLDLIAAWPSLQDTEIRSER